MEQLNAVTVALPFVLLIGGWLLVNALIDISALHFRNRLGDRLRADTKQPDPAPVSARDNSTVEGSFPPN